MNIVVAVGFLKFRPIARDLWGVFTSIAVQFADGAGDQLSA